MRTAGLFLACALASGQDDTNSLGMKLVRIEAGEFLMGSGEAPPRTKAEWEGRDADESPAHRVRITRPYFLSATEVTNAQYERFDPDHSKLRGKFGIPKGDDDPVTFVTWQQAVDFCTWLSRKESRPYRLPTEAEWEYACRAGSPTDDALTPEQANIGIAKDGKTRQGALPVGRYPPNAWGLYDMHGNVAEWCLDWHGPYEAGEQSDPLGRAAGTARVVRGWSTLKPSSLTVQRYARSANRAGHLPEDANRYTGFRVAVGELPATKLLPVPEPAALPKALPPLPAPDGAAYAPLAVPKLPANTWGPIYSYWNHYTTLCACPNGDILLVWYSTVAEEGRECSQAVSRLRAGSDAWEPPSVFFHVPDVNSHAPVLLSDGKRLFHFFTQSLAGWDDAAECLRVSEDNGATWSAPRIILSREDPLRMSQPCSALVAKDGKLVVAVDGDFGHRDERVMTSADGGATWKVGRGDLKKAAGAYAIHPAVVQRDDGALLAFMRGPDPLPSFASKDDGETWEAVPTPFPGISVGQKAAALKLRSGGLLLVSVDNRKGGGAYAALSLDDGKTWPHVRKLDGMGGYMSLTQAANGLIYLAAGQGGAGIKSAAFNEAWLKAGK